MHDDFRAGQICATVANVNRDSKRTPDPYSAGDFMPSLPSNKRSSEPIYHDDPALQAKLLKQILFKVKDDGK